MQMDSITPPIVLLYILMKDSCSPRSGWTVNPPAVLQLVSSLSNELQRAMSSVCRLWNSALPAYKALRISSSGGSALTHTHSHKDAHFFSVMHVQKLHRSQMLRFKRFYPDGLGCTFSIMLYFLNATDISRTSGCFLAYYAYFGLMTTWFNDQYLYYIIFHWCILAISCFFPKILSHR